MFARSSIPFPPRLGWALASILTLAVAPGPTLAAQDPGALPTPAAPPEPTPEPPPAVVAPAKNPAGASAPPARPSLPDAVTVVGRREPPPVGQATTASKTGTPLKDVPAAIVVVPKEILADQNAQTMNEAVRNASGITPVMGGAYGFADRYLMRGLGQRFLRDGLPDGPSFNGYFRTMTDVDAIEVLKGPGSALYGRTEPGGII